MKKKTKQRKRPPPTPLSSSSLTSSEDEEPVKKRPKKGKKKAPTLSDDDMLRSVETGPSTSALTPTEVQPEPHKPQKKKIQSKFHSLFLSHPTNL